MRRFRHGLDHDEKKSERNPSSIHVPSEGSQAFYLRTDQVASKKGEIHGVGDQSNNDPARNLRQIGSAAESLLTAFPYNKSMAQKVPDPSDYESFSWKCEDLFDELENLKFALHTVGASGPGILAVDATMKSFVKLRVLLGQNTCSLFPGDARLKKFISQSLRCVSDALASTKKALMDFKGIYFDESTMSLFDKLSKRFESESNKLSGVYALDTSPDVFKRNVQALLKSFLERAVEELRKQISKYCEKGVPVISRSQRMKTSRYLDLTTIATFLSGVTASMLQLSADDTDGIAAIGVNTFLFSSLVFSIAAAINSLLATSWRKSVVRDPNSYMPLWACVCLNSGPMISLVISVACFAVGICLFVFSSSQHVVTKTVTVSLAGLHAICLFVLAMWLILEKWKFRHEAGPLGQELMRDSMLAILDYIALAPEEINKAINPMMGPEPSQIKFGASRRRDGTGFYTGQQDYVRRNPYGYSFSEVGSTFSPTRGSRSGYSRASRRSEVPPRSEHDFHYHNDEMDTRHQSPPSTPTSLSTKAPETQYYGSDGDEETEYNYEARPRSRLSRRSRSRQGSYHVSNFEDEDHNKNSEMTEPIIIQAPHVESEAYERARFLPRNEQGDFEDASSMPFHEQIGDERRGAITYMNPNIRGNPISAKPDHIIRSDPLTTSPERFTAIPMNPPTYAVPLGSNVIYGTQPNIITSAQVGKPAAYTTDHAGLRKASVEPIFIPPAPVNRYRGYSSGPPSTVASLLSRKDSRIIYHSDEEDSESVPYITVDTGSPGAELLDDQESIRNTPWAKDSRQSSRDSSQWEEPSGREDVTNSDQAWQREPVHTHSTAQPIELASALTRSRTPRRTSSNSTQVRFGPSVIIQPRQKSVDVSPGYSGAYSTVPFLGGSLTTEPESIGQTNTEEYNDLGESTVYRGQSTSSQPDSISERGYGPPIHPRFGRRTVATELPVNKNNISMERRDLSLKDAEQTIEPPILRSNGPGHDHNIHQTMPTIDEGAQSSNNFIEVEHPAQTSMTIDHDPGDSSNR